MPRSTLGSLVAVLTAALVLVAGCGLTVPTDPDDTLQDVRRSGVLRVGASPAEGWVDVAARPPTGPEPRLVDALAEHVGVRVEWVVAGEEHLVTMLEEDDVDLAVGGFTEDNAWVAKVGLTRPYHRSGGKARVWMVPMGENAWQSTVERWLDRQEVDPGA
jgi:ABC-type amino acid transport substrate-binding protein